MNRRVYLAGPDVFLPDADRRAAWLKEVCARHGLVGVFPLDPLPGEPEAWAALPPARAIALRNEAHIRGCCALIANLTPFRGPGADGGTAFELGFARGLGRPVFGWSDAAGSYLDRCRRWPGAVRDGGAWRDPEGMEVEAFEMADNLMMACAVGEVVTGEGAFERCVAGAAGVLGGG